MKTSAPRIVRSRPHAAPWKGWSIPFLLLASLLTFVTVSGNASTLATDLDGKPITRLAPSGSRAVVLFFAASDCPIANRYIPEMQKIAKEFASTGVIVWFVYPNPGDDASVVRAHHAEFAVNPRTALDTKQTLVKMTHAIMTPEAAILVPDGEGWRMVYRGRIDDRYINLGTQRPQATRHDLEEGIRAVVNSQPVPKPGGSPVGCSIVPLQ